MFEKRAASSTRILHVITGLGPAGAPMALYRLLSKLDSASFGSVVVALCDEPGLGVRERVEALGVPVYSLGMRPGYPTPAAAWRLVHITYRTRPDLIHGWMYHANLAATLAVASSSRRVPVAWGIRQSLDMKAEKKLSAAVIRVGAHLSALPEWILYNSRASAKQHEAIGYRADRRRVIPNGFDYKVFRPDAEARPSVRDELGVGKETPLVGLIGRYHPMKDHDNFLKAASLLVRQGSDTHFLLAGLYVDISNKELRTKISALGLQGRVHLLGERQDMPRLNAALDIAASSSFVEAFPNVIGEAMACGVPCVVTDVGDSAWIVGETGRVVPPRDSVALYAAWRELLQMGHGPRAALGERARARIVRNFSLDVVARQYEELYTEMISRLRR